MALVKAEVFKNNHIDTEVILVPSERIFSIVPLGPRSDKPLTGIVPYEQAVKLLDGFAHLNTPYTDERGRLKGEPEKFLDYLHRTHPESANSLLTIRHPQGNGYNDTYYFMPQTVKEIAERQPDLISLTDASPRRPSAQAKPDQANTIGNGSR
ncbi:MAG: hypothetical protein AB7H77_02830 [Bdellovibrionales bacterium]